MKNSYKTYHLCLSGEDEVLFRDEEDYHRAFNCFALAIYKTRSIGLAEAFMSTHTHQIIQTTSPTDFMNVFRLAYSQYFNHKYQRFGKLGRRMHFSMEIVGYYHFLAALSYVLRNPLHHGVVPIPYAYPHCSANAFFRPEMGKFVGEKILPAHLCRKYIGRRAEFPDDYKMSERGVFLRESVLDVQQVENLFVSPRAFNFYMTRKSSEEWESEQLKDGEGLAPINLALIENGVQIDNFDKMMIFESGKSDYRSLTDIQLCTELDDLSRRKYGKHSVYQLSLDEKIQVAEYLYRVRHLSDAQIRRCLVLQKHK